MIVRHILAVVIIGGYLLVSAGIISLLPLGFTDLAGAKAMLEAWSAATSLLVGAVAGAYFPRAA